MLNPQVESSAGELTTESPALVPHLGASAPAREKRRPLPQAAQAGVALGGRVLRLGRKHLSDSESDSDEARGGSLRRG